MKNICALTLLFASTSFAWTAPATSQYPLKVHVVSSRIVMTYWGNLEIDTQILSVLTDGKKYQLKGNPIRLWPLSGVIAPGDYKGKIVRQKHKGAYAHAIEFQLLFPDGTTGKYILIGQSE